MSLIDKIMVVEGEQVEFSPEIKERMEKVFNDAVQRECDEHFVDGVQVVLDTMVKMGMKSSEKLVEEWLISDGVITVSGDDKQGAGEKKDYADIVAGLIG